MRLGWATVLAVGLRYGLNDVVFRLIHTYTTLMWVGLLSNGMANASNHPTPYKYGSLA
jgi:hypothetical protein